jgi:predicted ATPase
MYIALILAEEKVYILATNDFNVLAFTSLEKAISYFEDSYNCNHNRGYEASMSACLNFITYQPSVIKVENIEDIKNSVAAVEPKCVQLSHVSGFIKCITTRDKAIELWNKGKKPSLIKKVK